MEPHDPQAYWNDRARSNRYDPVRAVCLDDPADNACIDRVQRILLRAALRQLRGSARQQDKSVLDYGCGTGRWVRFFAHRGWHYSGVDLSVEMLEIARRCHPGSDLRHVRAGVLPYDDGAFDLVCSIAVLHHNSREAQDRILAEMLRVMKDEGELLLLEGLGTEDPASTIYHPRPLQDWLALAGRHGVSCVWHRGASYFILRSLIAHLARRRGSFGSAGRSASPSGSSRLSGRLVRRIDAVIDPWLLPLLPARFHTRAVMVLRRDPAPSSEGGTSRSAPRGYVV